MTVPKRGVPPARAGKVLRTVRAKVEACLRLCISIPAALIVLACSEPATGHGAVTPAQPDIQVVRTSYRVSGDTLATIRKDLDQRPRLGAADPGFDAFTTWRLDIPPWGQADCDPRSIAVSAVITVTLPELTDPDALPPAELALWNAYIQNLAKHEQRHVDLVTSGVTELARAIHSAPDCKRIFSTARSHDLRIKAESATLDEETGHGRTEGAGYPGSPPSGP